MNDRQLDRLLHRAQPGAGRRIGTFDLTGGEAELLEEIMSTPATETPDPLELLDVTAPAAPGPGRRRRLLVGVAAAAAFVVAVAGPALVFRGDRDAVHIGPSAPLRTVAGDGNPQLLLDDPGWVVTHVDQLAPNDGEMTFTKGDLELEVHWRPAKQYHGYYDDRLHVSAPQPLPLFGLEGAAFTYSSDDHALILPPQGKTFLEIRGNSDGLPAFATLVGRLKQVPAGEWLAAMPASVVAPKERSAVEAQMLADVPLPPGFDPAGPAATGTKDYYQFGAAVVGRVTCAWLGDYATARSAGDEAGMARVDKALSTSRNWTVLLRMDREGDYPEVVWEFAGRVTARQAVTGYESAFGCPGAETGQGAGKAP